MKIYFSDIRGADESMALYPPLSRSRGSAFGASLLALAVGEGAGSGRLLQGIKRLINGKPFFAEDPGLHFSISHSRSHVMVAVSRSPLGCDTLDHRRMRPETVCRLASARELEDFSFYQLWCLRESFFKLTGTGNLRDMSFYRENGRIISPRPDVFCRLYDEIPESSAAVCAYNDRFPDKLVEIPVERLMKDPKSRLT